MKREYYDEEMMLKEAITSQKTDQEIGMPDIEAELKRVKQEHLGDRDWVMGDGYLHLSANTQHLSANTQHLSANTQHLSANTQHLSANTQHLSANTQHLSANTQHLSANTQHLAWQRVAAIATIVITISGLSWAFVYYQNNKSAEATPVEQPTVVENVSKIATEQPKDSIEVKASDQLTLSYEKASLEQIIIDLSAYYHLDKPIFTDQMAARRYKMHITFNQKGSINDAIDLLNNFGSLQITLVDNKLMVK